jgi:geranylgeranyl diphosphate synthase, type II
MPATRVSKPEFDFNDYATKGRASVQAKLEEYLEKRQPEILWESMRYSVLAGGKRLRALLCLASAEACAPGSEALKAVLPCACAIELVHAMSLIHDDLPALDNDDLRRGQPTNHKVFGEAMALLAGDALLMLALEVVLEKTPTFVPAAVTIATAIELTRAAGAEGMVGGQVEDLLYTGVATAETKLLPGNGNETVDEATLASIPKRKTGALIRFAAWSGAKLAGASESQLKAMADFGDLLGLAFQIADDLLDVTGDAQTLGKTPGKDEASKKATWVRVFGKEESESRLIALEQNGLALLQACDLHEEAIPALAAILNYAIHRKN